MMVQLERKKFHLCQVMARLTIHGWSQCEKGEVHILV